MIFLADKAWQVDIAFDICRGDTALCILNRQLTTDNSVDLFRHMEVGR